MSLDQAPVSSQHVRAKLIQLADVPERELMVLSIITQITKDDRAETTVSRPRTDRMDVQSFWDSEIVRALHHLAGAANTLRWTMGRTVTIEWDGVCRPI